jgi:hypothetical protein
MLLSPCAACNLHCKEHYLELPSMAISLSGPENQSGVPAACRNAHGAVSQYESWIAHWAEHMCRTLAQIKAAACSKNLNALAAHALGSTSCGPSQLAGTK